MPTLNWIGKKAVENHHRQAPFHLLKEVPSLSVGDPGSGNLLVEGDNLLALKALLPYYAGQVKCIYIDPPYNTGNENWVYNDNVNSPEIRDWLGKVVGKETEDLTRHDKWLCMMYPRLAVLRQFLKEDGVIFVSIDDTELFLLKAMMDEIFGSQHFRACITWQRKYSVSNNYKGIATIVDYLLVYSKTDRCEIIKNTKKAWKYEPEVHQSHVLEKRLWWGAKGTNKVPALKLFLSEVRQGLTPHNWWSHEEVGHTDEAKKEIDRILGANAFETPKPTRLIERVLQIATNPGDLILDSFAGSGTTGHAVLNLNKQDGGNRRFILVEIDGKIARDITAERVRRVSEGYTNAKGERVEGLGGGFRFCELGEPLFDNRGNIRDTVRFGDLARHVYFTETGEPLPQAENSRKDAKAQRGFAATQGKKPPLTLPLAKGEKEGVHPKPENLPKNERLFDIASRRDSPLVGVCNGTAVYLLYNGILKDKSPDGGNVLTSGILAHLPSHKGPKVVYGTACRLGPERLRRENILFKQLPYKIRTI